MKIVCTHQHRQFEDYDLYRVFLDMITSPDMYNIVANDETLTIDWDNPTPPHIRTLEDIPQDLRNTENFFYLEVNNNPYDKESIRQELEKMRKDRH